MIATIKAEFRKTVRRPAFQVTAGLMSGLVAIAYAVRYYQVWNPTGREVALAPLERLQLYPHEFVNFVVSAGFPLGASVALVLGALAGGSDYQWGTMKTLLTQGPGRLAVVGGRMAVFVVWMLVVGCGMFAAAALGSVAAAVADGVTVSWPAAVDVVKGVGAMWLVLATNGVLGMTLGMLFRQAAVALGVGLIYVVVLEVTLVRFLIGLNGGAFKWVADLFDGQNAAALLQSFSSPAFGRVTAPEIDPTRAVVTLAAYLVAFVAVGAALVWRRDVA